MTTICRMTRLHWALACAALLLVSPAAGPEFAPAAVPVRDADGSLGRAEIATRLLGWNSRLGDVRAGRIADAVLRCEREQGLEPRLVLAVIRVESTARPGARSPKGAIGIMQVMPYMFDALELAGAPTHLETNIEAGCLLLADNIRRLGLEDGISSYFWGSRIGGDGYLRRVQAVLDELGDPAGRRRG